MKILVFLVSFNFISLSLYAHSGRTNTLGCHNSRSSGGYHCHKDTTVSNIVNKSSHVYNRKDYKHWIDADSDCQNTRNEVLIEESLTDVTLDQSGCKVISGKWYDPYTDQYFYNPRELDIDHFVPLKEAHISGAKYWSQAKKQNYANDLSNPNTLIAVASGANRSKSAKDPALWLPKNNDYICDYVKTWKEIKSKWQLFMDIQETKAIDKILSNCW